MQEVEKEVDLSECESDILRQTIKEMEKKISALLQDNVEAKTLLQDQLERFKLEFANILKDRGI